MDKILLVLHPFVRRITDFYKLDLGYAHGITSYLDRVSDVTILLLCDIDVRQYEGYLKTNFGFHVKVESLTEIDRLRLRPLDPRLVDYRPFVNISERVCDYITETSYDCVIFDVFDASGFITIRAKKTGLGLEKTLLVSWLRTCHEFERHQVLDTPKNFDPFSLAEQLNFAEKYCCENCDVVIPNTDRILEWASEQQWNIDSTKVIPIADIKSGRSLMPLDVKLTTVVPDRLQAHESREKGPFVSVCVAHFNDGPNLRYLLKSIKDNDYDNFEVIVVDDGSTDKVSLGILESLSLECESNSWRFIMKGKNEGPGPTRNFAVKHARGEFIIFVDSDDLTGKTMVSDMVWGMQKSKVDCLACSAVYFSNEGGVPDHAGFVGSWMPLGSCTELSFQENIFGGTYFCIKKSVFETLGGFSDILGIAEDWDFLARLVLSGFTMDVVPKRLYFYRKRSSSRFVSTWSSNSKQTLRRGLLAYAMPRYSRLVSDLLVQQIAENDRLRASTWNLDRTVVKIALKLSDIISEENRIRLQDVSVNILNKLRLIKSTTRLFLREKSDQILSIYNSILPARSTKSYDTVDELGRETNNSIFFVRSLSESQMADKLIDLGLPSDRPIFGFVGGLIEDKRPIGFLRLAYWMQMSKDDSFFVMVGDGPLREEVIAAVPKYNLYNFSYLLSLIKPEELYAFMSGVIITSKVETGPKEMFEALAIGVPVFSTDVGEARRVLGQYGGGLVVTHDPEHKDFADCFKLWKDNLEVYKAAARETAELVRRNFGSTT